MPSHPCFFPVPEPFKLCSGLHKKLHLHLFKLTHAEDKLPGNDLISEGFAYLSDTEGKLHAARLLNVKEIHKDALCGFGTQENLMALSEVDPISVANIRLNCRTSVQFLVPDTGHTISLST